MKIGFVSISMSLFVSLFAAIVFAAPVSHEITYYGEKFYQGLAAGNSETKLKADLKIILESYHQKVAGDFDRILSSCSGSSCYVHTSLGYDGARVVLMGVMGLIDHGDGTYAVHDVYCDEDKVTADFGGSGGPGPNKIPDGNILNTEHTWPQSRFGGGNNKGMQKADLHHLFPTDNKLNSIRGNNPFGEVISTAKPLKCPASRSGKSIDGRSGEVFEPPRNHRGNVARALFYFSTRYNMQIDAEQEVVLRKWSKEDIVDENEIQRNDDVQKIQGNRNPFVDYPELVDKISNF